MRDSGRGLTHRGSMTVTPTPSRYAEDAASTAKEAIAPTLTIKTSALSPRYKTSMPSRRSKAGISTCTAPFGKRTIDGASQISTASRRSSRNRAPSRGAPTCIVGTIPVSAKSQIPWWEGPSSPVIPARSNTNVTPALCSATSNKS